MIEKKNGWTLNFDLWETTESQCGEMCKKIQESIYLFANRGKMEEKLIR